MSTAIILLILLFVIGPGIIIFLEGKYKVVKKAGAVLMCYAVGLVIGNMGVVPEETVKYQNMLQLGSIALSLPLLLFSLDVKKWFKGAGKALGSLVIGLVSVLIVIVLGYWLFKDKIDQIYNVSGMLVGIYTGGTPNMAAIKTALGVSQELYILTHTYELALGAVYLLFVISVGQRVFMWILPPYKSSGNDLTPSHEQMQDDFESYDHIFDKKIFLPLLAAFGIAIGIAGVSYGLSLLVPADFQMAAAILLITSFGIAGSFIPKIKAIKKTFQLGMYLILIFCITVASQANVQMLADISVYLFYYVGLAMFGANIIHLIIARIFKIDADTTLIAGSALILSPPFVPVVAGAMKNKEVILTGLVVGIAGFAIGNYLGVAVAYLLK